MSITTGREERLVAAADGIEPGALRTLSAYLHDSHRGYDQGRRLTSDRFLRIEFAELAEKRERMAQEVDTLLRQHNEAPRKGGSTLGAAHRAYLDLKGSLFGQGRARVLREVVRGEAALEDAYDEALDSHELPAEARALLQRQHRQVRATRDRYAAMLDEDGGDQPVVPQGKGMVARFNRFTQPIVSNPILSAIAVTAVSVLTARLLRGHRYR
ncbi:PA2169 family four-helix-bundle protein [Pseudoroseomonas cervicalis]|uniref:PA2169 family four-helix-bundle protein n=1 Tax=Teichococcus cervicalis TaxID=204525 RepID=UPI0022F14746|nr:PA2169 family four-helix-bundle protein [Pseudoroseomonas cervicalis]WBV41941.1 PA2169 family four-helix-bundle protein [Pseudoroseomonas cervicalis]